MCTQKQSRIRLVQYRNTISPSNISQCQQPLISKVDWRLGLRSNLLIVSLWMFFPCINSLQGWDIPSPFMDMPVVACWKTQLKLGFETAGSGWPVQTSSQLDMVWPAQVMFWNQLHDPHGHAGWPTHTQLDRLMTSSVFKLVNLA